MAAYRNVQRHIVHRGREFHFVSYEGTPADTRREVEAMPPTWYLLNAGKRWPVMPHQVDEPEDEVERRLIEWLDSNVFND
ncbi:MAG TPA: hypothetical protein VLE53_14295 [Gemmatimonadaceae bacterium]|nr:hypothetical protein [Gemmatimonadaceae bacterium]